MSMNKVIMHGNLASDPELKKVGQYDTALVSFGLGVNTKTKQGEETVFIKCVMFGKRAEALAKYVSKGSPLLIEGRLQSSDWKDKHGQKRLSFNILVDNFVFLGTKSAPKAEEPTEPEPDAEVSQDDNPF